MPCVSTLSILDYPFGFHKRLSCVSNVASVSTLSIRDCPFGVLFIIVYLLYTDYDFKVDWFIDYQGVYI